MRPGSGDLSYSIPERLHMIAERYVLLYLEHLSHRKRATKEHGILLDLWLKRYIEAFRKSVHTHISQTRRDLTSDMEYPLATNPSKK